jgi:CheY-like chemotaxis protein
MVTGDPHRLRQVVWNLLSNATKFTPDGGTIRVRCARAGARIELSVTDDGEGIDPSFLPFVFERFRQADSSATRGHGGLGLGLSLVRHLVEAHGGTAAASSEGPGKGATVSVSLPARQMPARTAAADSETEDLRGRRVLVLEDNDDARMLTAMMLETMGAEVVACGNVAEALDTMTRREPDVIVADLALPGHDGLGFLREVRERGVRVPALAVTAYSEPERREEAYAAGFGGFVTKPVTPEKLHAELRSLLQNIGAV